MTPKIDAICLPLLLCVAGVLLSGCDRAADERLAQLAERALREQAEQNVRLVTVSSLVAQRVRGASGHREGCVVPCDVSVALSPRGRRRDIGSQVLPHLRR